MKGSAKYYTLQRHKILQSSSRKLFFCCTKSATLLSFRISSINQLNELYQLTRVSVGFLGIIYCIWLIKRHIGVLYKTKYDHGVAVQILQHAKKELMGVTGTTIRHRDTEKQHSVQLPRYAKYVIKLNTEKAVGAKVKSKSILLNINSSEFLLLAQATEKLADFVQTSWKDLPEKEQQDLRELVSNLSSKTEDNYNLLSNLKLKFLMFWIKIRCSEASINAFAKASRHLTKAVTKAIKLENSAEIRAIKRLASTDNPLEWDTITEPDEDINIEEVNQYLKTRGYNLQIPRESSSESQ